MEGASRYIAFIRSLYDTAKKRRERRVRAQMEEAKKVDIRSKLRTEQRKGRKQEEPKAKKKTNEKDEFCP
ncbi:uncharacterized protein MONOS_16609 [Monocercomonoides exilis]|uniref:uncharacterized protein n=1 Tax=Monocercomonoides exilis TaxID=2049356 RepID=UPI00355A35BD|nr:hypothetical protein MONOS_16609 [Monocercomonoides exilis]|eukprot:MONOS_16609.1-p1 / transcript=MONOS_16609.1 / gene=MONOS_16609 / organism=Monocercomonoides_exilis_PA203 / gene_product=unspecified product / transcript_product=unspecified product / location=Mono_scaffold01920:503-712(-) / protein_length=70 / sequence_SO=supercontig / SO=protein_coding / is_pseudo=false